MDTVLQDVRYAVRLLRKNMGFSAMVILIVAIGVGAAATIFSIVEKSLLSDVLRSTLREGWRLLIAGLTIGIAGALLATRLMRSLVFDVSTSDPVIFLIAATVLAIVALLACYVPARRVTTIDPMIALRYE